VDDSDRTKWVQAAGTPSAFRPEDPTRTSVTPRRAALVLVEAIVRGLRCGTGAAVPSARHRSRFHTAHVGAGRTAGVGSRPVAPGPRTSAAPPCRMAAGWLPQVSANRSGGDPGQPPGGAVAAGWRIAAGPSHGK
jgi:hypothetical protein